MKMWKSKTWRHEVTGTQSNVMLFGVDIFHCQWTATGKTVIPQDPQSSFTLPVTVYAVEINGQAYEFAAEEVSNGVWAFYTFRY